MAKRDPKAKQANVELRAAFGDTPEVRKAIKRTQEIRSLSSASIDYADTLTKVYSQITGGKNGAHRAS